MPPITGSFTVGLFSSASFPELQFNHFSVGGEYTYLQKEYFAVNHKTVP